MALAKSNTNDLASLFKEGFFRIPKYQRRYSWENRQQLDLFHDLFEAYKTQTPHFLGTLSLQLIENKGFDSYYNIIDGQQRFTSLMILFSTLAKKMSTSEYTGRLKRNNEYFFEPLNDKDDIFFRNILDGKKIKPETNSQKLMLDARTLYEKLISKMDQNELLNFCNFILNKAHFLIYLVENLSESIRMFEVINDRGLPLGYFDKIKSFFMYYSNKYLNNSISNNIESSFNIIYNFFDSDNLNLGINNDDTLLLYHYLSNPSLFPNWSYTKATSNIILDIKKDLIEHAQNDKNKGKEFIEIYLQDIKDFIESVISIEKKIATHEKYRDFYLYLAPAQRMFPLSIRFNIKNILDDTISLLEKIEFYLKYRRDPKKDVFSILKDTIDYKGKKEKLLKEINNKLYYIWETQTDEIEIMNNADWAAKFILYKYNKKKFKQDIKVNKYKELEIEHIFSQEPSFPIENYGFDEESYRTLIYKIGNLTLLEKNLNGSGRASNKTPEDKINEDYIDSDIKMTQGIAFKNKKSIEERTELLKTFAHNYLKIELL